LGISRFAPAFDHDHLRLDQIHGLVVGKRALIDHITFANTRSASSKAPAAIACRQILS
jgi:hypothetical protein